jgi:Xaa-Pro aminopeptidase
MADAAAGPEAAPGFGPEEYRDRLARMRAAMAEHGIDALLLTQPADIFYLSGFLTRFWESPARPWFLVVPAREDPVAVIPAIGAALMRRTWQGALRCWDAPDPADDGVSLLAETLRDCVVPGGAIGLPMGLETHLRMPLADYARVADALAPRRLVDATAVVQRTREIKSPAEIARIRATCAIAGRAFDALGEIARPGVPLERVFRDFQARLLAEGADWVSYVAGAAGPAGYADVISPATATPLAAGDVVMLDTGAVKDGYFCDFDRNLFLGPPAPAVARAQEALWEVTEEALSALQPGLLACDVHALLAGGLARRGLEAAPGRLGHGLGLTLTEWPSFTPRDATPLRAGMVLTLEPSAFTDGAHFLTHEENIVLTETGVDLLSPRAPRLQLGAAA